MIGIDLPLLLVLVVKFVELLFFRSSVYLYVLDQQYLVFWIITFVLLGAYCLFRIRDRKGSTLAYRLGIIVFLGLFLIGSLLVIQLAARRATDPVLYTHDGAIQTEDAIAALAHGENPYQIDYRSRMFGAYPDVFSEATRPNPAWNHFIYLPLPVLLGVPSAYLAHALFGWFDVRMLYFFSFLLLVTAGTLLARRGEQRVLVLIFLLFNPLFTQFFVGGFNDVFFLGWIALAVLLIERGRWFPAALAIGLALASKQSAWMIIPFFIAHAWFYLRPDRTTMIRRIWPAAVVALILILPFVIWSPGSFIDDTVRYPGGTAALSYPISGFGLGQLFLSMGIVRSMWDPYPFWILQLIVGIPAAILLIRWQKVHSTTSRMLLAYGFFLFLMWFTSRFFNDSYIGVLSVIFLLGYAVARNEENS